jgi:hypothetical protein
LQKTRYFYFFSVNEKVDLRHALISGLGIMPDKQFLVGNPDLETVNPVSILILSLDCE